MTSQLVIEQGHRMGRPSGLIVQVEDDTVRLKGRCLTAASGVLRL